MKTAFISIGCHVGANMVRLIDMGYNREVLEEAKSLKNPGEGYKVFELTPELAHDIHAWFINIGMDGADAIRHTVKIGHTFNEAQNAGRKAKQEQALDAVRNEAVHVLREADQQD